jgi:ABC-type uncharacterized transport system substrate-binding protein
MFPKHLQGKKNTTLSFFSVMLLAVFALTPASSFAKDKHVSIISSSNSPVYKQIIDGIKNTVNNNGAGHVTFEIIYADKLSPAINISNADLLLTIGRRAMLGVLQRKKSPPIVATLLPRQAFEENLSALRAINKNVTAIYIDTPAERQILLAKLLLGSSQTLGILLSDNSPTPKETIRSIAKRAKISIHIEDVKPADNIIRKLSSALTISDALLALPDPQIFNRNTARDILLTTYRKRVPVIGLSANYVKAGALAASFSSPEQIAVQTGKAILEILRTTPNFPTGGKYIEDFDIAINPNVARSLGINVPPKRQLKKALKELLTQYK